MTNETLTPEAAQRANQLLAFLVEKSTTDWEAVMKKTLTESERELNLRNMESKLVDFDLEAPYGALEGGTGIAKDAAGLEGELGQEAIQTLKQHGRLQQCGRGRGKCLLILSAEPFPELGHAEAEAEPAITPEANADTEMIAADNVPTLLRAARDQYRTIERNLQEALRRCGVLEHQVEALEATLSERDQMIQELENKIEAQVVATWQ